MSMSKFKLNFDPAAADDFDNVGTFLRASDGTLLTHTDVGGKKSLDVNVANEVTVNATDLDIRDLAFASDSVTAHQGGTWTIDSITNDVNVTATDLDIRDLAFASDSVTSHQGGTWTIDSITNDVNVTASQLDIDDLDYTSDNVAIKGSTGNQLVVNADGSLNVNADISVVNGMEKEEDAAHVSGDIGAYMLSVRQDTLASSTSADGDYQSLKTDSLGRMWVNVDKAAAPSFNSWLVSQNTVTDTAELIVAADLSNRKRILIQNVSTNRTLYLGQSNAVTTADGIMLPPGNSIELDIAAGTAIYGIANAASVDARVAEFAA